MIEVGLKSKDIPRRGIVISKVKKNMRVCLKINSLEGEVTGDQGDKIGELACRDQSSLC